jgi:hypothetical protein
MNIESQSQKGLSLKIRKSTAWAFLAVLLYRIVLDLAYYFVISPAFSYARFTLDLNALKLVESYLLLFIVFALMPKSTKKLSNVLVWLLILISYVPMLTLFAFVDEPRLYMYAVTAFWLVIFMLMYLPIPNIILAPLKQSRVIRYSLFICLGVVVFLLIYKYLGLSFSFDITKSYDVRSQYIEAEIPIAGYIFNWLAFVASPIFVALFIRQRKWLLVAIIVLLQILLFSVTGFKSFLFALPFVFALIWIIQRKNPLLYMGLGLFAVVLVGLLISCLADNMWVSSLFTRRALLVPGLLSFLYFDFFSQHPLVFLSASKIGFFANYPYHLPPGNLIGDVYFNTPARNACTGIVGDAYMNFGFIGLALWAVLLFIILKLIDSCSREVDLRIGVAAIAIPAITLTNSALLTNLLTYGLWLVLLLLYLLPKKTENEYLLAPG